MKQYKENLVRLFCAFHGILNSETLVVRTTVLPVTQPACDRVIMEGMRFISDTLCHEVLLMTDITSSIARDDCFNVLDLHHVMRRHIQWRLPDGIHNYAQCPSDTE